MTDENGANSLLVADSVNEIQGGAARLAGGRDRVLLIFDDISCIDPVKHQPHWNITRREARGARAIVEAAMTNAASPKMRGTSGDTEEAYIDNI